MSRKTELNRYNALKHMTPDEMLEYSSMLEKQNEHLSAVNSLMDAYVQCMKEELDYQKGIYKEQYQVDKLGKRLSDFRKEYYGRLLKESNDDLEVMDLNEEED